MLPKVFPILEKLSLILSLVNARMVLENVKTQLPGERLQIETLAASVCNDLDSMIQDQKSRNACPDNFWSPVLRPTHQTEVTIRCRSRGTLHIEVTPCDCLQLVVLIPEIPKEDEIINYSLFESNTKFGEISVYTPTQNYIIFATVLDKDGRPSLWQAQAKVPALSEDSVSHYDVQVQFMNYSRTSEMRVVTGVAVWNHTGDLDVCFEIFNYCNKGTMNKMRVWPGEEQKVIIEKLPLDDECEIIVKGMYGTTQLKYRTPAPDAYKDKDPIETEVSKKEARLEIPKEISIVATEDGDVWKVRVGWAKPRYPPERYNVTLGANGYTTLLLPGNATEANFTDVTGKGLYNASIEAFKGKFRAGVFRRALFPDRVSWHWVGAWGGLWGGVTLAVLTAAFCCLRHTRTLSRNIAPLSHESKPLDEGIESPELEPCEDQWEVNSERLLLHEVIGEGAFGVVRRGSLAPTGKDVAVKMLKDFPSLDEVKAFRLEMELMKSVGTHPHVVSLVGCCSSKRPFIIAEYCARGDLLSFLRCSWDIMVSKRNAKYYNNNINTSDYRNDLFKCSSPRENSRFAVNKMYDFQSACDSDLTSLDLLSFCRQIAMGMEFLASNRLVHRDLAARNVLVTGDKTLKIADFGLSRDVYEENQYKQKGNGKMPVKWMALESLTRRIYSSQSDVWSFGVVMWEVVTVGGAPYPDVPAARLPRLLRAGYRMPRPPNCSKQLYELMQWCWRAQPRWRPTFAELHRRLDDLLNCACADDYLCLELDTPPAPTPTPAPHRYFKMIMRGKRAWTRESYERPLKAIQSNYNHYTSPPVTLSKAPA